MNSVKISVFLTLSSFLCYPAEAQTVKYRGLCEASAAAVMDDTHFIVASDDKDSVAVYQSDGKLKERIPVNWSDDLGKLSDIEGAVKIGRTTFWITSHSLTDSRKRKKKRFKLFATVNENGKPVEVGKKAKDLEEVLRVILANVVPEANIGDETKSTLNIEGLAATPAGELLVGLRAPLSKDREALVVNLGDPFILVGLPANEQQVDSAFPQVSRVQLGGRGIRSLELLPLADSQFGIIAGASGKEETSFAFFKWDGSNNVSEVDGIDFKDMQPEAMIAWPDGLISIFGDNGDVCQDKKGPGDNVNSWFPGLALK